jgi:hypothetical protein
MSRMPSSLEFLRAVYLNNELPLSVRMRAAMAVLPFEHPKLAVTAVVGEKDFASLLEARINRWKLREEANNGHTQLGITSQDFAKLEAKPTGRSFIRRF